MPWLIPIMIMNIWKMRCICLKKNYSLLKLRQKCLCSQTLHGLCNIILNISFEDYMVIKRNSLSFSISKILLSFVFFVIPILKSFLIHFMTELHIIKHCAVSRTLFKLIQLGPFQILCLTSKITQVFIIVINIYFFYLHLNKRSCQR